MGAAILSFARSFPVVFVKIMGKIVLDLVEGTIRTSTREVSREYMVPSQLVSRTDMAKQSYCRPFKAATASSNSSELNSLQGDHLRRGTHIRLSVRQPFIIFCFRPL